MGNRRGRQGEVRNGSRRREEADSGAKNTSASLPWRLRLLRRYLNSSCAGDDARSTRHCARGTVRLGSPHDLVDLGGAGGDFDSVMSLVERLFARGRKRFGLGEGPELSGRPKPPGRLEL